MLQEYQAKQVYQSGKYKELKTMYLIKTIYCEIELGSSIRILKLMMLWGD